MKKIAKWLLVLAVCSFSFPAWATVTHSVTVNGNNYTVSCEGDVYIFYDGSRVYLYSDYAFPQPDTSFDMGYQGNAERWGFYYSSFPDVPVVSFSEEIPTYTPSSLTVTDIWKEIRNGSVPPFVSSSLGDQEYVYDPSIPSPRNLMFTTREDGGNFIIAGTKYYGLSWTPPVDNTLMCRIDANVTNKSTGHGGFTKTQYVRLAGEAPDLLVSADSGKYEFTVSQIEDKIGGHLGKLDYIRLQYYRLKEGQIFVGPISTVRLKLGLFGKYTYVVTTEYPNDETDVGDSGGLDDTYHDKWTSDGENYYEYDQEGNLIDSGTNDSGSWGDSLKGLIDSLLNIPTIVTRLFSSLSEMMSGIGALPAYFAQVVSWLPAEILSLIGLGIIVVIALRIFGR